jgi:hypothetical protein
MLYLAVKVSTDCPRYTNKLSVEDDASRPATVRLALRRPLLGNPVLILVEDLRGSSLRNRSALQRITQLSGQ